MNDPLLSFLGIIKKSGNLIFGMDPVKKELSKNNIDLIIVTSDISKSSLKEIQSAAIKYDIKLLQVAVTKEDINSSVRKYCAIMGISGKGFAKKISDITHSHTSFQQTSKNNLEECNL